MGFAASVASIRHTWPRHPHEIGREKLVWKDFAAAGTATRNGQQRDRSHDTESALWADRQAQRVGIPPYRSGRYSSAHHSNRTANSTLHPARLPLERSNSRLVFGALLDVGRRPGKQHDVSLRVDFLEQETSHSEGRASDCLHHPDLRAYAVAVLHPHRQRPLAPLRIHTSDLVPATHSARTSPAAHGLTGLEAFARHGLEESAMAKSLLVPLLQPNSDSAVPRSVPYGPQRTLGCSHRIR